MEGGHLNRTFVVVGRKHRGQKAENENHDWKDIVCLLNLGGKHSVAEGLRYSAAEGVDLDMLKQTCHSHVEVLEKGRAGWRDRLN